MTSTHFSLNLESFEIFKNEFDCSDTEDESGEELFGECKRYELDLGGIKSLVPFYEKLLEMRSAMRITLSFLSFPNWGALDDINKGRMPGNLYGILSKKMIMGYFDNSDFDKHKYKARKIEDLKDALNKYYVDEILFPAELLFEDQGLTSLLIGNESGIIKEADAPIAVKIVNMGRLLTLEKRKTSFPYMSLYETFHLVSHRITSIDFSTINFGELFKRKSTSLLLHFYPRLKKVEIGKTRKGQTVIVFVDKLANVLAKNKGNGTVAWKRI